MPCFALLFGCQLFDFSPFRLSPFCQLRGRGSVVVRWWYRSSGLAGYSCCWDEVLLACPLTCLLSCPIVVLQWRVLWLLKSLLIWYWADPGVARALHSFFWHTPRLPIAYVFSVYLPWSHGLDGFTSHGFIILTVSTLQCCSCLTLFPAMSDTVWMALVNGILVNGTLVMARSKRAFVALFGTCSQQVVRRFTSNLSSVTRRSKFKLQS